MRSSKCTFITRIIKSETRPLFSSLVNMKDHKTLRILGSSSIIWMAARHTLIQRDFVLKIFRGINCKPDAL